MRIEVVKTVTEVYEIDEKDIHTIVNDYGGNVKEYILYEKEPISEDEDVDEFNYNIEELRRLEKKVLNVTPLEYFIKYMGKVKKQCEIEEQKCKPITDKQLELLKLLSPFTNSYENPFGDEFKGVRFFKDYAEASDMAILVRVNIQTELDDRIKSSLVLGVAAEFSKDKVMVCEKGFCVKDDNGNNLCYSVPKLMDTIGKMFFKDKSAKPINLEEVDISDEYCEIDGAKFRSEYIKKILKLASDFDYHIEDNVLKLRKDDIEIYLAETIER